MDIKGYFKDFFKTRWVGWYICLCTVPLILIGNIIYRVGYADMNMQRFFSASAYAVAYVTIVLCIAVSFVRPVEKWAPLIVFALTLCSFCLFVNGSFMYLSSVFFGGLTAEAFASLNPSFTATIIFQALTVIAALVALFVPHEKKAKNTVARAISENTENIEIAEETTEPAETVNATVVGEITEG